MNIITNAKKDTEEDNVVPFKLLAGGADGGEGNWLSRLEAKEIFLCRRRSNGMNRTFEAMLFQVAYHFGRCTRLIDPVNARDAGFVVTDEFSRQMEWLNTIAKEVESEKQEEEETANDTDSKDNRPD